MRPARTTEHLRRVDPGRPAVRLVRRVVLPMAVLGMACVWPAPLEASDSIEEPAGLLGTLGEMVLRGGVLMVPIALGPTGPGI